MFHQDLQATPPNEWKVFWKQIIAADGLLFLTPEYKYPPYSAMAAMIEDWRSSSKSKKQYCLDKGINEAKFYPKDLFP